LATFAELKLDFAASSSCNKVGAVKTTWNIS